MPKGLVQGPKDEAAWAKAKARVREEYGSDISEKDDRFWALVNAIYGKMTGRDTKKSRGAALVDLLKAGPRCASCGGEVNKRKHHAYWSADPVHKDPKNPLKFGRKYYGCQTCTESGKYDKWLDRQKGRPKPVRAPAGTQENAKPKGPARLNRLDRLGLGMPGPSSKWAPGGPPAGTGRARVKPYSRQGHPVAGYEQARPTGHGHAEKIPEMWLAGATRKNELSGMNPKDAQHAAIKTWLEQGRMDEERKAREALWHKKLQNVELPEDGLSEDDMDRGTYPAKSRGAVLMDMLKSPSCPMCGNPGEKLGTLGSRTHFRCRGCGMDYHRSKPMAMTIPGGPHERDTTLKPRTEPREQYAGYDKSRGGALVDLLKAQTRVKPHSRSGRPVLGYEQARRDASRDAPPAWTRPKKIRYKEGFANAPSHEVYGQVIADKHGGDWRKYADWIRQQPDQLEAVKRLSDDRAKAWDILMGVDTDLPPEKQPHRSRAWKKKWMPADKSLTGAVRYLDLATGTVRIARA